MGNTNQQIQKQLQFVQRLEDKYFGPIDIFKNNEGIYIMKIDRNHVKGDLHQQSHHKILQYVGKQQQHGDIIPIVHIQTHQENGFCLAYECTSIYTEYYNHTLADMLSSKKVFEQPQLWLILSNILKLIIRLKENKLAISLNLNSIFLTLKGLPCISHHHLYSTENTVACCQFNMSQQLAKIIVEIVTQKVLGEVQSLNDNLELAELVVKVQNKYKILGKVVKELLRKEKTDRQVLDDIVKMEVTSKIKKAKQIKLTKYKYIIPDVKMLNSQNPIKSYQPPMPLRNITQNNSTQLNRQIPSATKHIQSTKKTQSSGRKQSLSTVSKKQKQTEKKQTPLINDFSTKNTFVMNKEESIKILSDLQRRKLQYQNQMERFIMRKEELLCQSQKQNNLKESRPVPIETDHKKKVKQDSKRKRTETGTKIRFR